MYDHLPHAHPLVVQVDVAVEVVVQLVLLVQASVETVIEATNGTDDRLIYEASDLIYHLIVLLTSKGHRIEELATELKKRHKV